MGKEFNIQVAKACIIQIASHHQERNKIKQNIQSSTKRLLKAIKGKLQVTYKK